MIHFDCDYMNGALPQILQRLAETNLEANDGYGADKHCENARQLIREACEAPDAQVFFTVGGTQTNKIVIDALLDR
ncbi:MAG: low specificity L-threonine aldolase, partial [Muribaculaceae bacterium]|nr:low specificity L-threonine aldolase [Muribaculaceae bacterium]